MKRLSDSEIDDYLWGPGMVEIEIEDPVTEGEIFTFLKKQGGFMATKSGTYRVTRETLKLILDRGYPIREITKESK
ncbi:MAG: hypothetical protein NT009_07870 [Proteobacteria bacterium]|jgi:hypothetical protein|nr:hypothetical protein [Pseudomonadota bacterium]